MAAPSPSSSSASAQAVEASEGPLVAPHLPQQQDSAARRMASALAARKDRVCTAKDRISRMPPCAAGKRSSIYRGVTRHRWTGRYEAHLWDKSTWNQNQNKKGKQVYLGAYDDEKAAARAYDLAALKYWGAKTIINFPVEDYARDLEEMQTVSKEDYLVSLRRKSSAFSRGLPKYRGLHRLHNSKLDASLGQAVGNDCINLSCSNAASIEGNYMGGFGLERKVDLTHCIRWWVPKKSRQAELSKSEDILDEIRALESSMTPTEPYKLPSLGQAGNTEPDTRCMSACDALLHSDAFRNFLEKSVSLPEEKDHLPSKDQEPMKAFTVSGNENDKPINIGLTDLLAQRVPYGLDPQLPMPPLKPDWSTVDSAVDTLFWGNYGLPSSQSLMMAPPTTTGASVSLPPPTSNCF